MRRFIAAALLVLIGPGLVYADPLNPLDFSSLGTVTLGAGSWTLNADTATLTGPGSYTGTIYQAGGLNGVAVFSFDSLSVSSGATINVTGSLPVAFLTAGNMTFSGTINASGGDDSVPAGGNAVAGGFSGGNGSYNSIPGSAGAGYGGGGCPSSAGVGGGGGFGGAGGSVNGSGSSGAVNGNILARLQGGSGGGGGNHGTSNAFAGGGGGGGGCIELGALGPLAFSGVVRVLGGGSHNGPWGYAGGGGSGGGVLIHASTVSLSGTVAANGGFGSNGGGGGGGQVVIQSPHTVVTTSISVAGGAGAGGGPGSETYWGSTGTISIAHGILTPTNLNFGGVLVGTNFNQFMGIQNTGDAGTAINGRFPTASDVFSGGSNVFSDLQQNRYTAAPYTFSPPTTGTASQTLTFLSDGGAASVTLTGVGVAPEASVNTNTASTSAFVGSTNTASVTVQNAGNGNLSGIGAVSNLNGTIASGSGAFSLTGGTSISLADGASQTFNYTYTATQFGPSSLNLSASFSNGSPDGTNSANTQPFPLSGTGIDHSNASLSSTGALLTEAIPFGNGNFLRGAIVPSQPFTIGNLAANTSALYTANIKLTGFSMSGNTAAFQTNLAPFSGLAAGNYNTFTVSLNTSNYTTSGTAAITMSASQLADDSTLPGAGSNNSGGLTITLDANVGNATADASNFQHAFGTALTAPVALNGSYTNLEATAMATSGSRGYGLIGSTATILAGTNSSGSSQTVGMQWRTEMLTERTSPALISDVLHLTGMSLDDTGQTSPFVLQMTYNPSLLPLGAGSEGVWASNESVYLGWLDPSDGQWKNAIDGNFGANAGSFHLGAWVPGDMVLGDWGVNTANDTVWAVIDHNSDFAVVPEPSTLVLLVVAVGLLGYAWRRRNKTNLSSRNCLAKWRSGPQPACRAGE